MRRRRAKRVRPAVQRAVLCIFAGSRVLRSASQCLVTSRTSSPLREAAGSAYATAGDVQQCSTVIIAMRPRGVCDAQAEVLVACEQRLLFRTSRRPLGREDTLSELRFRKFFAAQPVAW